VREFERPAHADAHRHVAEELIDHSFSRGRTSATPRSLRSSRTRS